MAKKVQDPNGKGSLKQLQILINDYSYLINQKLNEQLNIQESSKIVWVSPLINDRYAEYTDDDFIKRVGLDIKEIKLNEFWPNGGPNWDALANTDKGSVILVEAKANIPELSSPPSRAREKSLKKIEKSLAEVKDFLNVTKKVNWARTYYQYTNRIAHLYFLREWRKVDAFLVNIYFIGDKSVNGPQTKVEWKEAINEMLTDLGLNSHPLKQYMTDVFIDVNELK